MRRYVISTGTITYAIKGRDLLRKNGYRVTVERVTSGLGSAGCGYTLVLDGDIVGAEALLRRAGVKILDISEK